MKRIVRKTPKFLLLSPPLLCGNNRMIKDEDYDYQLKVQLEEKNCGKSLS